MTSTKPKSAKTRKQGSKSRRPATTGAAKPAPPDRSSGPRGAVGSVLSRHRADLWGLGLVVAGLLVAGSVWVSVAGPVGRAIDDLLGLGVGQLRVLVPLGLVAAGVALVRGDDHGDPSERLARVLVGSTLLVVAVTGLLHVLRGRPGIEDPVAEIGDAGGMVGIAAGGPLDALVATWGSVLVLGFAATAGLIVLTGSSARAIGGAIARAGGPAGRLARRGGAALFGDPTGSEPTIDLRSGSLFDQDADPGPEPAPPDEPTPAPDPADEAPRRSARPRRRSAPAEPINEAEQQALRLDPSRGRSRWKLPPPSMLSRSPNRSVDQREVAHRGRLLQATLDQFGVPTTLLDPVVGPTVTRFVLELGEGVKVAKLESLRKDIAYAMASPDVRILAPIPGRRAIGIEVPNLDRHIVAVGDILSSKEARAAAHPLEVAVGRDINGRAVLMNLATMPHVLIGGATNAGKSSCLNSMITSILMRSTPDQVRMILIDPKRVEMGQYDLTPHLLTAPVTDPRKAANALAWAVREMERRYDLLHKVGFRDITGYNEAVDRDELSAGPGEVDEHGDPLVYRRLPFVLIVVDELADLMMVAARDVEESIARIAQMARAVGIHLVIATQRPSVNVITGVIKANVPARLAFAVASLTDSRVILDQPGAERLVGRGDMLLLGPSSSAPHRIQGCWVEESEVRALVKYWRDQAPRFVADHTVATDEEESDPSGSTGGGASRVGPPGITGSPSPGAVSPLDEAITDAPPEAGDDGDELLIQAMELVVQTQLGSTSMLQRKLRVGFARAGRIMDLLEQRGIVGPSTGSKARDVLITPEELAEGRGRI
ncbi:MAG: DNA translocase FtsK 4TM domain-containing protein [Acidimicrobiales bacterium]